MRRRRADNREKRLAIERRRTFVAAGDERRWRRCESTRPVDLVCVPPQELIAPDFMCSALPGIGIDPARAAEQITASINKHVLH